MPACDAFCICVCIGIANPACDGFRLCKEMRAGLLQIAIIRLRSSSRSSRSSNRTSAASCREQSKVVLPGQGLHDWPLREQNERQILSMLLTSIHSWRFILKLSLTQD